MVWSTICLDVYRHAWRLRLPVVLLFAILLLVVGLPTFLASDGTLEGKVKLFFLYSGYLQVFIMAMIATVWTIWLEKLEQKKQVNWMIAVKPVKRIQILTARMLGNFSMIMAFFVLTSFIIAYISQGIVNDSDVSEADKELVANKLKEVRTKEAIKLVSDYHYQGKRINGNNFEVIPIKAGQVISYELNLENSFNDFRVEGSFESNSVKLPILVQWRLRKGNKVIDQKMVKSVSSRPFDIQIRSALAQHSPLHIDFRHSSKNNKTLYVLKNKPFVLTVPKGSIYGNMLMAMCKLSLLCMALIAISIFISQFLSFQGSLFITAAVFVTGFFKDEIYKLIFPPKPPLPNGMQMDAPMSLNEMFYTVLWKPILYFIPDFSKLNPATAVSHGDWISWSDIGLALLQVLPFLLVLYVLLLYFLPKQELGRPR